MSQGFPHARYDALVTETFDRIRELGTKKGGEYAGDTDRLANFRRNGVAQDLPMATIWAIYAAKHWDAIQQWIKDDRKGTKRDRLEPIEGRVDDLIVYLLLFKAILEERNGYNDGLSGLNPHGVLLVDLPEPTFNPQDNRRYGPNPVIVDAGGAGMDDWAPVVPEPMTMDGQPYHGLLDPRAHPVEDAWDFRTNPEGYNVPGRNALGERE